jgi:hypothetical protein
LQEKVSKNVRKKKKKCKDDEGNLGKNIKKEK